MSLRYGGLRVVSFMDIDILWSDSRTGDTYRNPVHHRAHTADQKNVLTQHPDRIQDLPVPQAVVAPSKQRPHLAGFSPFTTHHVESNHPAPLHKPAAGT